MPILKIVKARAESETNENSQRFDDQSAGDK
jgi:hypothetical protein